MRLSRRGRVVIATVGVAVVEWLLFELVRTPYHPPRDMLPVLGQEKYSVFNFMGMIATGWSLYVLCDGLRPLPTMRECLGFAGLLSALTAVVTVVVFYPPWWVTPFELLCK